MADAAAAERILAVALAEFGTRGFAAVNPGDVAVAAGVSLDDLYRHFPRKESFVLGLYHRLAGDLEASVAELPAGTVAERFRALAATKLRLLEPHRRLLAALLPAMLNPEGGLGVLGPHVERTRDRVRGIFRAAVLGARDAPPSGREDRLVNVLSAVHLGLVFLCLQDQTPGGHLADDALELATGLLEAGGFLVGRGPGPLARALARLLGLPDLGRLAGQLDGVVGAFIRPPHDSAHYTTAEAILRDFFRHRRLQPDAGNCAREPCPQCLALHLPRVQAAVAAGRPVHFVLPAFPARSANPQKVLGPLPDLGEELALRFLQARCDAVRERYPPGARLTICSDGRVFNDLVGVSDDAVTAYRARILAMIAELELTSLEVFDLDDMQPGGDFAATRRWLEEHYAEPEADLRQRTAFHEHHRQLFNGIHRFLTEDLLGREPGLSRTQARNRSKDPAYAVVRRSNAWGRLVAGCFPDAVRLSIHPQPPHSEKVGILLTPAEDVWLTPWHGVALLKPEGFVLTRRADAEAAGAVLVEREGRPSHFEMPPLP